MARVNSVRGTMGGPWLGIEPTHRSFTCAFVNVVPFRNGKMQGEQIETAVQLTRGVDVLLHDSQYTREEFPARAHFGHSSIDYAVGLAAHAGSRQLVLFHHDPWRSDAQLDSIVASWAWAALPVTAAVEWDMLDVGSASARI
jgi:hypothetical protein